MLTLYFQPQTSIVSSSLLVFPFVSHFFAEPPSASRDCWTKFLYETNATRICAPIPTLPCQRNAWLRMASNTTSDSISLAATTAQHDFAIDSNDDSRQRFENFEHDESRNGEYKEVVLEQADEPPYSNSRRLSFIDQDQVEAQPELPEKKREGPVSWMELPHKRQLAILTVARLSEPLVQTSLQVCVKRRQLLLTYSYYECS